ncbi:MAG: glycosyltransferase [Leptospiraceae bacterium]|nr:glycosyltransferase [Leptospiraceae bacterium]MDW8307472.1 glycosyltransferase [Leptospiraceae bacterium]
MKLRVMMFSDSYLPKIDGVGISTDRFCRILAKKGHEFLICAPLYEKDNHMGNDKNIRVERFGNVSLPSYPDVKIVLPARKKLDRLVKEFRPHLIHFHTPGILGQFGIAVSQKHKIPLIGTYHTMMNELGTYLSPIRLLRLDRLLSRFMKNKGVRKAVKDAERKREKSFTNRLIFRITNRVYEKGQVIITPTELVKKELELFGVMTPIVIISNGMDLSLFKGKAKKKPHSPPRLLHVGRLAHEKNCDVVLRAFARIHEKIPGATLTFTGDGPSRESLEKEARELGLQNQVSFTGFIPHEKLPEIYAAHDLFVTASTMETQGLVVLEALAMGLPAVGVDAYALPEVIQNGLNGYIVHPFDSEGLAAAIASILQNHDLYARFSEASLQIASAHEVHSCAEKLEKLYLRVAKGEFAHSSSGNR